LAESISNLPVSPPDDGGESELRRKKIGLETQLLTQQLKPRYWLLEIVKVIVGALTLAGVVVTLYLGLNQIEDARQSRDDERFEKAVARLGGSTATERLAGVAGLGLYLEPRQKARHRATLHRATLHFLVNALAVEQDGTVRGELLDSLSQITPTVVGQEDLNDALERLRDRNRSLYARQRGIFMDKLIRGAAQPTDKGNNETYLGQASAEDLAALRATATAITSMVRNGARTKDLSNIYCVGCDFTGKTWEMMNPNFSKVADFAHADTADTLELSGTNFDGAILRDSNFIGADLRAASFDSADLIHVNFAGAELSDAKFTDYGHRDYFTSSMVTAGYAYPPPFPDFTCADLSGADFTGSVFLGIYGDGSNDAAYPILYQANLANAKFGKMWILTVSKVPPNYTPTPSDQVSSFLFQGSEQVGSTANIRSRSGEPVIINEFWGSPSLQIREPVPSGYSMSVRLVFSELASARNLDRSQLPQGLKDFILRNQKSFSIPNHPTPCTPKH
jgi:uncharacterized protein YjbI with pentapeptide repeats